MPEHIKAERIKAEQVKATPTSAATAADVELARAALLEITTADKIGQPAGSIIETDGVITLYFDTTMRGYVGWKWTVSISHGEGSSVSVLETELTPAEGALLSPDWVPWSERLADYKEAQAALAAEAQDDDDHDDDGDHDDDDDDDDFDDEDVNDDDEALLHSGDLDGVDIDSLDDSDAFEAHDEGSGEPKASALPVVRGNKAKQTKDEPDDARPEPPVKPRRNQRTKKHQQNNEGE